MSEAARPAKEATVHNSAAAVMVVMLVTTVLLPLLYVLSLGPAVMLLERGRVDAEFWNWFYGPLRWLYDQAEFIQPFLDWYVELWR